MSETYEERKARLAPLNEELQRLNQAVEDAVKTRTEWMDAHMPDYAVVQIGEELYDGEYRLRGIVTKLYRYHGGGRDWRYDTSMSISYEYKTRDGSNNNTSGQSMWTVYSRADKEAHERYQYESLKRRFEPKEDKANG
jgi:hypothetical protein